MRRKLLQLKFSTFLSKWQAAGLEKKLKVIGKLWKNVIQAIRRNF